MHQFIHLVKKKRFWSAIAGLFIFLVLIILLFLRYGDLLSLNFFQRQTKQIQTKVATEPTEVKFITEVYQIVKQNYWQHLSEEQLVNRFKLSLDRVYGPSAELEKKDLAHLKQKVSWLVSNQPNADQQRLLPQAVDYFLRNLPPRNRSRLYSKKQTTQLRQRVANINPKENYLKVLDLPADASDAAVNQAFILKKKAIRQTASSAAQVKKQLALAQQAYNVLGDQVNRQRYVKTKIEPTISGQLLNKTTFYLKVKQFSPTTIDDLQHVLTQQLAQARPHILILDLRDNVGGAIDYLPYLTGIFIGKQQYAYQFFAQGKTTNFITQAQRLPALAQFKQTVVLINHQTQSSAEVLASVLKKYHIGVLLGVTTRGWGTVERVFPLKTQLSQKQNYAVFLVHHLTLAGNGLPIEGRGIKPDVSLSQASWPEQLKNYGFAPITIKNLQQLLNKRHF